MADSMVVFAPHANSWRRLASRSYAPVAPTWGFNNRSVAVRLPAGPIAARRFEHRVAGVDANPYVVAAAVLAGLRRGLESRLDPGPAVDGNGYKECQQSSGQMVADNLSHATRQGCVVLKCWVTVRWSSSESAR
jgi:glutamine synthetase